MDSDSDKDKYYASQESEDEEEPRSPSRRFSISHPPSPDYSASSSEDEDDVGNVAGQQPQPSQWTLPPKPRMRVVHTFIGTPAGDCGMLARAGHEPRPSMAVGRPAQASTNTSQDWTQVTLNTDLVAITRKADVACVQRGGV